MYFIKNSCNKPQKYQSTSDIFVFTFGAVLGATATAAAFLFGEAKKKKCSLKNVLKGCCDFEIGTDGPSPCDCEPEQCDDEHYDHERARNSFDCHAEECDTAILHSSGCLGYPHDDCGGFADSNGDRPNDTSNPEIDRQKGADAGKASPYLAKNSCEKSNPQPENKVNEVKKKH